MRRGPAGGAPGGPALYGDRDWDAYHVLLADDLRFVDHRPLGFADCGPDGFLEIVQSGVDAAHDLVQIVRKVFVSGAACLTVLEGSGTDDGRWSTAVGPIRRDATRRPRSGRALEWFAEDDFDAALPVRRAQVRKLIAPEHPLERRHEPCDRALGQAC